MEYELAESANQDIWIISEPRHGRFAIDHGGKDGSPIVGQEYRISNIGRYLLSPQPLTVQKWLIGCEISQKKNLIKRVQNKWGRTDIQQKNDTAKPLTLYLNQPNIKNTLTTAELNHYLDTLYNHLRPFDLFFIEINKIISHQIEKLVGICEDDAGFRSPLTLEGTVSQQLDYLRQHVGKPVSVKLKRAYLSNGLFEMKGFNFQNYRPNQYSRLIRFVQNGLPKACVVNADNTISFWVDDFKIINYLQLLNYCIHHNKKMYESFYNCMHGKSIPIRLMFNQSITIDYTRAPLPAIFQKILGNSSIADQTQKLIKKNLSAHQMGISFNSLTQQKKGGNTICTDIAILQNLRALEPIKNHVPTLFAQMEKIAARSEGEIYYLLEAIRGVDNES